jgi:hypothetical protein
MIENIAGCKAAARLHSALMARSQRMTVILHFALNAMAMWLPGV